ncbi:ATP-grasp domain-containing protein [Bacillus sp. CLL-7-23]|uniref:ATP-grasp domain-containing protein n=1 Tax=Bacillus changyiensis TaxID=3004103 RepID=A0ABT4X4Q6_9BACI|nr:ATP-grasp domain-containing protein [Bacillus changyiensis]MDA7027253.1 ATP-grasp domain-containing protein [Bacillus changyiensis]
MKRLALLLHHAGTAPDLIYPSLEKLNDVEVITFYIKSPTNKTLNQVYHSVVGSIGPGFECKNEKDMVKKVVAFHKEQKIDGLITFAEMLLKAVSEIAKEIGISFMTPNIIERVQHKALQRKRLHEKNIPIPKYFEIKDKNDLLEAAEKIGFPSLLKPNFGGGGYGIFEINCLEELFEKYDEQCFKYENIITEGEESTFNLEEKMIGTKWHENDHLADYVSVESLIIDSHVHHLTVSDRTKLYQPFRESGYITPTSLKKSYVDSLYRLTTSALKALELNNIMSHTEIKFTDEGPKIIEVNARPGGTTPFRINNASNGEFDVFYELAKLSLDENVSTDINFYKYAASKISLCPVGEWRIKKITFTKINDIESIDLMIPIAQAGQKVSSFRGIEDLLGLYYLSNKSLNHLINDMYLIDKKLMVDYEPFS